MSLDETNFPDPDRDRDKGKPSAGKSLTILVIFAIIAISVALFVSHRSDPSRENDPKITAPTAGSPAQP